MKSDIAKTRTIVFGATLCIVLAVMLSICAVTTAEYAVDSGEQLSQVCSATAIADSSAYIGGVSIADGLGCAYEPFGTGSKVYSDEEVRFDMVPAHAESAKIILASSRNRTLESGQVFASFAPKKAFTLLCLLNVNSVDGGGSPILPSVTVEQTLREWSDTTMVAVTDNKIIFEIYRLDFATTDIGASVSVSGNANRNGTMFVLGLIETARLNQNQYVLDEQSLSNGDIESSFSAYGTIFDEVQYDGFDLDAYGVTVEPAHSVTDRDGYTQLGLRVLDYVSESSQTGTKSVKYYNTEQAYVQAPKKGGFGYFATKFSAQNSDFELSFDYFMDKYVDEEQTAGNKFIRLLVQNGAEFDPAGAQSVGWLYIDNFQSSATNATVADNVRLSCRNRSSINHAHDQELTGQEAGKSVGVWYSVKLRFTRVEDSFVYDVLTKRAQDTDWEIVGTSVNSIYKGSALPDHLILATGNNACCDITVANLKVAKIQRNLVEQISISGNPIGHNFHEDTHAYYMSDARVVKPQADTPYFEFRGTAFSEDDILVELGASAEGYTVQKQLDTTRGLITIRLLDSANAVTDEYKLVFDRYALYMRSVGGAVSGFYSASTVGDEVSLIPLTTGTKLYAMDNTALSFSKIPYNYIDADFVVQRRAYSTNAVGSELFSFSATAAHDLTAVMAIKYDTAVEHSYFATNGWTATANFFADSAGGRYRAYEKAYSGHSAFTIRYSSADFGGEKPLLMFKCLDWMDKDAVSNINNLSLNQDNPLPIGWNINYYTDYDKGKLSVSSEAVDGREAIRLTDCTSLNGLFVSRCFEEQSKSFEVHFDLYLDGYASNRYLRMFLSDGEVGADCASIGAITLYLDYDKGERQLKQWTESADKALSVTGSLSDIEDRWIRVSYVVDYEAKIYTIVFSDSADSSAPICSYSGEINGESLSGGVNTFTLSTYNGGDSSYSFADFEVKPIKTASMTATDIRLGNKSGGITVPLTDFNAYSTAVGDGQPSIGYFGSFNRYYGYFLNSDNRLFEVVEYYDGTGWREVDFSYADGSVFFDLNGTTYEILIVGNRDKLSQALSRYATYDEARYTAEDWLAVATAHTEVSAIADGGGYDYALINTASTALNTALDGLPFLVTANAETTYEIVCDQVTARAGETISFSAERSTGYVVNTVEVKDNAGNLIPHTAMRGGYSFEMPSSNVTISAQWSLADISDTEPLGINKVYDGEGEELTYLATHELAVSFQWYRLDEAFVNMEGETSSKLALRGAVSDSGTYKCVAIVRGANDTMVETQRSVVVSITPKPLTVTAEPKASVVGEAFVELTYTLSDEPVAGDGLNGALATDADNSRQGRYPIMQGTLSASQNYELSFVGALYTVKPVTVSTDEAVTDNGKVQASISDTSGFEPETELSVQIKNIADISTLPVPDGKVVMGAYNAELSVSGVAVEPNGEVTLSFAKPDGVATDESYTVILVEGGAPIEKVVTIVEDRFSFSASSLGDFVLLGNAAQPEEEQPTEPSQPEQNPVTPEMSDGKNASRWWIPLTVIGCLALIALCVTAVVRNRRTKKRADEKTEE